RAGVRGDEQPDAGRYQLALARADRVGVPDQLRMTVLVVHQRAVTPLLRVLALRAPRFARRLRPRGPPPRAVQLVDRVERAHRVTGKHVGESRREATPGDDACAARAGVGVEREE